ncbi:HAD-IIIA family hydrolase [Oxalobacter sp. OttesenSCG-928-P03]|nr:HAD-IIIA family hydrolase [Oxalobacter sp. OttesenSCG-928-P03]
MKDKKVLFVDLDGTLIETLSGETFPKGVWDMTFKLDVWEKIKALNPDYIAIVSNQGGIEKGLVDKQTFNLKIGYVETALAGFVDLPADAVVALFCDSNDPSDNYRKPNTGMLAFALSSLGDEAEDADESLMLMIGDASGKPGQFSDSDKKCAENFGIDYLDVEDFLALPL